MNINNVISGVKCRNEDKLQLLKERSMEPKLKKIQIMR